MSSFLLAPDARWPSGLALVRVAAGVLIAKHGWAVFDADGMRSMGAWLTNDLHVPAGAHLAYVAKGTEFFGGLLLAIGLLTRPAALLLAVTLAVAAFGAHAGAVLAEGETALVYLLLFLAFFFAGPGRWSLDYWLTARRRAFGGAGARR